MSSFDSNFGSKFCLQILVSHFYTKTHVCLGVSLCKCVSVGLCFQQQKKNWSVNLNLEHIVVYRNSSNEFDIGHNTNCKVLYFSFAQVRKLWLRKLNIVMRVRSYELLEIF